MKKLKKYKNDKKYEHGLRDLVNIPLSYLKDFCSIAHTSRKKSFGTFVVQIINIVLVFYIGLKVIPFLLDFISNSSQDIHISNLESFFLMLIFVLATSVLSEKIKLSELFKWDFYASIIISISLILAIVGFQYYTERLKKPN